MEKYLEIIKYDIRRFILNYLQEGALDGLKGNSDVDAYIPDIYPYLCTLYLIRRNYPPEAIEEFVRHHEDILIEETRKLKLVLGYYFTDLDEVSRLKEQNDSLKALNKDLTDKVAKLDSHNASLTSEISSMKDEKQQLTSEISNLKHEKELLASENEELIHTISGITNKSKESHNTILLESRIDHDEKHEVLAKIVKLPTSLLPNNKKCPNKKDINESNIYTTLIQAFLPCGKYVFESDIVRDLDLDIAKLNVILTRNYRVKPISLDYIGNMTFKQFKKHLVQLLSE